MADVNHDSFARFFAGLSPNSVDSLCRNAALELVPPKAVLFEKGAGPQALLVLGEGLVHLFHAASGRETTLMIARPLACLNTISALCNLPPPVSARTIERSFVLRIPAAAVRRAFDLDANFRKLIIRDLTTAQDMMRQELLSLRSRNTFERLKDWALAMCRAAGYASTIDMPYGKSLLAARLGMAPETLSRNLALLEDLGVSLHDRTLRIADVESFRKSAEDDEAATPLAPP